MRNSSKLCVAPYGLTEKGRINIFRLPNQRAAKLWGRSSAGRASRSQCEGQEFDPPRLHQIFQWVSRSTEVQKIGLSQWCHSDGTNGWLLSENAGPNGKPRSDATANSRSPKVSRLKAMPSHGLDEQKAHLTKVSSLIFSEATATIR